MIKYTLEKFYKESIQFKRKYDYIIFPILILCIYIYLYKFTNIIVFHDNFLNNIISISGSLIGFLITAHSVLMTMPTDKKFIQLLKQYGYFKKMFIEILCSEITFIVCIILSLFEVNIFVASIFFMLGLSYTLILSMTLFEISFNIIK